SDALHFALRIDTPKVPADLLRAYTQLELEALAADNPSGIPSARQKREARLAARERLEHEAKDGRFIRRKSCPILWDSHRGELLVGTAGKTVIERLYTLFKQSFGHGFEILGAGERAFLLAEERQQSRGVDDARPSDFVPGLSTGELAWVADENSRDFLG